MVVCSSGQQVGPSKSDMMSLFRQRVVNTVCATGGPDGNQIPAVPNGGIASQTHAMMTEESANVLTRGVASQIVGQVMMRGGQNVAMSGASGQQMDTRGGQHTVYVGDSLEQAQLEGQCGWEIVCEVSFDRVNVIYW